MKERQVKKKLSFLLLTLVLMLIATPLFAQGGAAEGGATPETIKWVAIASAFGMAFASGICGLAQGRATAAAAEGLARNPAATAAIRFALILGLALIESLALYTFVIIFIKVVPVYKP